MFNKNIDIDSAHKQYSSRNLAVIKDVLTKEGQKSLIDEAKRLMPLAQKNLNLLQVNSGQLLKEDSSFIRFGKSQELENLINNIMRKNYRVGVCPGDPSTNYSLKKSDFGTKVNFYDGDNLNSINWHYDKNHSWKDDTIVVIYTILFRNKTSGSASNPPGCYEIIEKGKKVSFAIPENALHIHDTNNVYHRAVIPKGWNRWIYILHFTKKPCTPGVKRNGYTTSLVSRNIFMRSYVELFVENKGQIFIAFIIIMIILKLYKNI